MLDGRLYIARRGRVCEQCFGPSPLDLVVYGKGSASGTLRNISR